MLKEFFRPNLIKLWLFLASLTMGIILSGIIIISSGFQESVYIWILLFVLGAIIAYLIACIVDMAVKNKMVKIIIASILAFVSIIAGYFVIKSLNMVYDPVMVYDFLPTSCEDACYSALEKAGERTPEILQKLDECLQSCR